MRIKPYLQVTDVVLVPGGQYEAVCTLQHKVILFAVAILVHSYVGVLLWSVVIGHTRVLAISKQIYHLRYSIKLSSLE